jgi:hypothetical protein
MIKALLLIFRPVATWEGIVSSRARWPRVFAGHVLPMLLLACAAEGYGMAHWGKPRGPLDRLYLFSPRETAIYEAGQFILFIVIIFFGARVIKSLGETFHGRHTFDQTFTVAAYGLSPMFLFHLFNAFRDISPWVTWIPGIVLSLAAIYHGLPRVMLPDPPHAFGLYLSSAFLLLLMTALGRFMTAWYLAGRFARLDELISRFTH